MQTIICQLNFHRLTEGNGFHDMHSELFLCKCEIFTIDRTYNVHAHVLRTWSVPRSWLFVDEAVLTINPSFERSRIALCHTTRHFTAYDSDLYICIHLKRLKLFSVKQKNIHDTKLYLHWNASHLQVISLHFRSIRFSVWRANMYAEIFSLRFCVHYLALHDFHEYLGL